MCDTCLLWSICSRWDSIGDQLPLLISDYSVNALLYSALQAHKQTERATVGPRGVALSVHEGVCDS